MGVNAYRFHSLWRFTEPPDVVYEALARAEEYPSWWPQVREVVSLSERTGTARFRSLLPYDLWVTARAECQDRERGVLQIAMRGDLDGWARWTVRAEGGGSCARYEQYVVVRKPLLRALALPARPLLVANHALMMRAGRRGLRAWLRRGLDEG